MKNFCFILSIVFFATKNQAFGSEAGMPQLNPEFWMAQIFWLILIFTTLYLIVSKVFLPKITYSIENRKSKVVDDLQEAQKLKESAEKKLNEYNQIIDNSKNEAKKIIEDSAKNLDLDIAKKKLQFNKEIEEELKTVENEIKELKKNSIANIETIATESSGEIVKQIVGTEVNKSNVSAIVNDLIKTKIEKYI